MAAFHSAARRAKAGKKAGKKVGIQSTGFSASASPSPSWYSPSPSPSPPPSSSPVVSAITRKRDTDQDLVFNCHEMTGGLDYSEEREQMFGIQAQLCATKGTDLDELKVGLLNEDIVPSLAEKMLDCQLDDPYEFSAIVWQKQDSGTMSNPVDQGDGSSCSDWAGFQIQVNYLKELEQQRRLEPKEQLSDMTLAALFYGVLVEVMDQIGPRPGLVSLAMLGFSNIEGTESTAESDSSGEEEETVNTDRFVNNEAKEPGNGKNGNGLSALAIFFIVFAVVMVVAVVAFCIYKYCQKRKLYAFEDSQDVEKENRTVEDDDATTTVDDDLDATVLQEVESYDPNDHFSLAPEPSFVANRNFLISENEVEVTSVSTPQEPSGYCCGDGEYF